MNIKTPDYKAQAENLRATLLSYIDCMQEVQIENEDLKQRAELYKAFIFERDKKIFNQKVTIENLFKERDELKKRIEELETILYIYEGRKND